MATMHLFSTTSLSDRQYCSLERPHNVSGAERAEKSGERRSVEREAAERERSGERAESAAQA